MKCFDGGFLRSLPTTTRLAFPLLIIHHAYCILFLSHPFQYFFPSNSAYARLNYRV
jgi:hypothetical protein